SSCAISFPQIRRRISEEQTDDRRPEVLESHHDDRTGVRAQRARKQDEECNGPERAADVRESSDENDPEEWNVPHLRECLGIHDSPEILNLRFPDLCFDYR